MPFEPVERAAARRHLLKAEEFLTGAREAVSNGAWNLATMNAVHAGIAAADAYLVAAHGIRSTGADHKETASLLRKRGAPKENIGQLIRLLEVKSPVEYDDKLFKAKDAIGAVTRAERLVVWSRALVEDAT